MIVCGGSGGDGGGERLRRGSIRQATASDTALGTENFEDY